MSYEQVFGLSSQFNEDVIFLKDVRINGQISFGTDITFNVPVTFDENVTFKKSIAVDENVSVGGISTFTGLIDANASVDVADTLTVRQRLNVGVSGTVISADVNNEKIGFFNEDPIYTRFQKAEQQSWDNVKDAIGGVGKSKPFMMVAMPEGTSDGLCIFRLSELENVIEAIQDNWRRNEENK